MKKDVASSIIVILFALGFLGSIFLPSALHFLPEWIAWIPVAVCFLSVLLARLFIEYRGKNLIGSFIYILCMSSGFLTISFLLVDRFADRSAPIECSLQVVAIHPAAFVSPPTIEMVGSCPNGDPIHLAVSSWASSHVIKIGDTYNIPIGMGAFGIHDMKDAN